MPVTVDQLETITPEQFLFRFRKLWRNQKRELLEIAGKPPDLSRIKPEHWKRWKAEQQAALILLMGGYALMQLRTTLDSFGRENPELVDQVIGDRRQAIERQFLRDIRSRASFAATAITRTSRRRLQSAAESESGSASSRSIQATVFSDSRSQMITTTEMTAARSAAVHAVYTGLKEPVLKETGLSLHLVWRLRPCQHCIVCPLLDGTTSDFWGRFFPGGPPIHPRCCCQTEIRIGSKKALQSIGIISKNPPIIEVERAIRKSRINW